MIARLIPRYGEPHRRYHTWAHVAHVFSTSEQISWDRSIQLSLAIFYHDAICDPLAKDNEERSAALLVDEGKRFGVPESVLAESAALVRLTANAGAALLGRDRDLGHSVRDRASVLLDADLSILGQSEDVFDAYEDAIQKEYATVPDDLFRPGRRKILVDLLARRTIFFTEHGRKLWEEAARENLTRSVARLGEPVKT